MKSLLALLIIILLTGPANAQWPTQNYLGARWDPESSAYDAFCHYQQINQITTLALYLINPVNPEFGYEGERDVTNVGGFECAVTTTEGATILGYTFPPNAFNYGSGDDLVVYFGEPVPVIDGRATLATFDVFFGGPLSFDIPDAIMARCVNHDNCWLYVNPVSQGNIPGFVSYTDADDPFNPTIAGVCTGSQIDLSFELYQNQSVPTEIGSWDSLKAIYR